LIVTIGYSRSYFEKNNEFNIKPLIISTCIKKAIASGWNHTSDESKLELDCSDLVKDLINKNVLE